MFGKYDKFTLTLTNAKDINGNILLFQLELLLNDEYSLPDELASIDVLNVMTDQLLKVMLFIVFV